MRIGDMRINDVARTIGEHWGLVSDQPLRQAVGTNNLTLVLESDGGRFVVRVHQNSSLDQIRAEHRLLDALTVQGVPFAIPEPVRTRSGGTVVETADGPLSVVRFLPGSAPDATDPRHQYAAGVALGRLMQAMAAVPEELAPATWSGHLNQIAPEIRDLQELLRRLEAAPTLAPYVDGLGTTIEAHRPPRPGLPRQIVHGDFGYANLLVTDDQVSAVLDFEVAGLDVRVNDLVTTLSTSTQAPDPSDDAHVAAICRGFGSVLRISPVEAEEIPRLLLNRVLAVVVWRVGRWLRGHDTPTDVAERLAALARYEEAVAAHGDHLVDLVGPLVT